MADAFRFLQSVAPDYGAALVATSGGGQADITIIRPGGSRRTFHLVVAINGQHASVQELPGQNTLPAFCPDRHINLGGTFCLGWNEDNPSTIIDVHAARRWWSAVSQFLARQVNADVRRVFPGGEHGRAHGDAARHQANAEEAAARLGQAFAQKALSGQFTVRKDDRPGKRRLELWHGAKRIARVSMRSQSLVGGHSLCPCGVNPPREISECGEHSTDLAIFVLEHHKCAEADRAFLDELVSLGYACCETLNTCGLRESIKRNRAKTTKKETPHARRSKYWQPPAKSKRPR
jgi:hypothetical protein